MKEIIIDGDIIDSKSQVNEIFVRELGLPEYCGNNLDDIAEFLDDWAEPVLIIFKNRERLKLKFGRFATVLSQMLKLSAKHNDNIVYKECK